MKVARYSIALMAVLCVLTIWASPRACAQDMKNQVLRGHEMVSAIKDDIKQHYYDRNFHGLNLDERFASADAQIDTAISGDQIYGIVANTLLAFEDSHTFFIPPLASMDVDYGWEMQMVGDKCYVTSVEVGSNAQTQGVKPGDQVLAIFDVPIDRGSLWQIEYLFYKLRPVNPMVVTVQAPGGSPKRLDLKARVEKATWASIGARERQESLTVQYYREVGTDLFVWKMSKFDLGAKGVDEMMKKVGDHKTLVLDLRGNGGGYEGMLQYLLGYFFDHEVKIGDRKGRKESKPVIVKSRGEKSYKGQVIVLVDSRSASAAEILARVIQLEKRGTVLGDHTAGAVTEAQHFYHEYVRRKGFLVSALAVTYGVSVTINDLIMADGKSLERLGVTPDELILPTATQLAQGEDPVLKRAGELAGVTLDRTKGNEFRALTGPP
jgi:C-terminal processing protease CtpA/Prc